jgi:hypothetical protein
MPSAIGPLTRDRHDSMGNMSQLAQILLGSQLDAMSSLGVAGFINDENPCRMRT